MAKQVEVEYRHHVGEHKPGDTEKLPEDEARKLVQSGQAAYPEKKAATGGSGSSS